jgi:hypothetical protein
VNIDKLRALCFDKNNILMTYHVSEQCRIRGIAGKDIICAILNGEIIEDYPDDYPFPSALVLGRDSENNILHTVVGAGNNKLWIITAYYPGTDKWESDFKTRKVIK